MADYHPSLVTLGYVHHTPAQGLHPRDEAPYAIANWGELLGNPQKALGLNYEEVAFEAVDGSTLRGWLIAGTSNKAIIAASRNDNISLVIAENPFASAADVLAESDFFDQLPHWYARLVVLFTRLKFDMFNEPDTMLSR